MLMAKILPFILLLCIPLSGFASTKPIIKDCGQALTEPSLLASEAELESIIQQVGELSYRDPAGETVWSLNKTQAEQLYRVATHHQRSPKDSAADLRTLFDPGYSLDFNMYLKLLDIAYIQKRAPSLVRASVEEALQKFRHDFKLNLDSTDLLYCVDLYRLSVVYYKSIDRIGADILKLQQSNSHL